MATTRRQNILANHLSNKNDPTYYVGKKVRFVFISLLLLIIAHPFLDESRSALFIYTILLTFVSLTAAYAFSYDRRHLIISSGLGIAFALVNWINFFFNHAALTVSNALISTIFFVYVVHVIIQYITREHEVNGNTIYGAISGYLLIGFMFASIYGFVNTLVPKSFSTQTDWGNLVYYSFSTLTTTGIGDITATTSLTRSLTIVEAITGVLYVAILIAALVGRAKRR